MQHDVRRHAGPVCELLAVEWVLTHSSPLLSVSTMVGQYGSQVGEQDTHDHQCHGESFGWHASPHWATHSPAPTAGYFASLALYSVTSWHATCSMMTFRHCKCDKLGCLLCARVVVL